MNFQKNVQQPICFRVSKAADDCCINCMKLLHVMSSHREKILHYVYRDVKHTGATIVQIQTTQEVWRAFLDYWVTA